MTAPRTCGIVSNGVYSGCSGKELSSLIASKEDMDLADSSRRLAWRHYDALGSPGCASTVSGPLSSTHSGGGP